MKYSKVRLSNSWIIKLKCGVIKEMVDNGETYYWGFDEDDNAEVFNTLKEAKEFTRGE